VQDNTKGVGHSHKRDGRRIMDAAEYQWKDTTTVPKQTMNVVHHTQKHGRTRFGNHETFMDGKKERRRSKVAQEAAIVRRWGVQRDT
jgi:hypothetical protein